MYPKKLKAHERNVNIVRFNYDGDLIFSGDADRVINVFEAFTGQRLGSYSTKTSVKTLDVDINSKYLIYGSFDGTVQMFDVRTGKCIKHTNFSYSKIMQVEFALGSKKFFILDAGMESKIKIVDFEAFLAAKPDQDDCVKSQAIKLISNFEVKWDDKKKISEKAAWYVDNQSIFVSTLTGEIIHFSENGKVINKALIHNGGKIKDLTFAKDFSILATAASDGCKIVDPETLEILRFFKQEVPMNAVSVSPLFCTQNEKNAKYHVIVGGGTPAIYAAMTKCAGFEAHICNVMDEKEIGKILCHFGPINSIEFFKDGQGYVSAGEDGFVVVVRFDQSYFDNSKFQ